MLRILFSKGQNARNVSLQLVLYAVVVLFVASCSIQEFVIEELSNTLTGSGGTEVFLGDDDPQLVADALPFAIKVYESLLSINSDHDGLALTTGSLYIMYANAFVQLPASMFPVEDFEQRQEDYQRARKLYIRGRDILGDALERKYPGLNEAVLSGEGLDTYTQAFVEDDIRLLYWYASGWFAPVAIDSFDVDILLRLPAVLEILNAAYALNPNFNNGAFEELFIAVYSALPEAMGGGHDKSIQSFERALELQGGGSAGPYVSLALSVARPQQNREWFVELLEAALAIDPDEYPETRLINTIMQERAEWFLARIDDYFI